ncbi:MAG: hypothetical protein IJR44_01525 [Neisseriaceae bacterium]|nr:hypothetical protein [Neisseriaceae bacterium]
MPPHGKCCPSTGSALHGKCFQVAIKQKTPSLLGGLFFRLPTLKKA